MIRKEDAIEYHTAERAGKIELRATKACLTPREMRLAYLPGALYPAQEIASNKELVFRYTARGNLVGVITNGSAVPGLGAVGPAAAKPVQEGVAVLFKRLADIDVFDLEVDTQDAGELARMIRLLEPTFGGILLKDVRAPEGMDLNDQLSGSLQIPVLHENLYSTAVVACAALRNALDLVEKRIDSVRVVICGAGMIGTGCARLFRRLGLPGENLLVYDVHGLLHPDRDDLHPYQRALAQADSARTLSAGLGGADVFVGASAAGVLSGAMIRDMARYPIVFALATPEPEIDYELARASRRDLILATALGQYPNAILDVLSFPYIFRGALDAQATRITEGMLIAAAQALADLAREEVIEEVQLAYGNQLSGFGPDYILPKPTDPRILVRESAAVAEAARVEGMARTAVETTAYRERLAVRMGTGRDTLRGLMLRARQASLRVLFSEGQNETVLRACRIVLDEAIARPVLLGDEKAIRETAARLRLDLGGAVILDPLRTPRRAFYEEEYFRMRRRRGIMPATARERLTHPECFAALALHSGDADMMIAGVGRHYADSLRTILEIIGPAPGVEKIASVNMVLLPKGVYLLADCTVNIEPTAEDLAQIALMAAATARRLGIEPHVAMLSFSDFGSSDHALCRKVRRAAVLAKSRASNLIVDGEMQLMTAINAAVREEYFSWSDLKENANVLIFPDLQSGNIALHLLQNTAEAVTVGPILVGTRLPAHLLQYGAKVHDLVNLTAVGVVEATSTPAAD